MNLFLVIEILFIILYSFAIIKNYFKRVSLKKNSHYVIIKNYNLSFIITLTLLVILVFIYLIFIDTHSIAEKILSVFIILLLVLNTLINSNILLTHDSLYYMYYNVPYNEIESVIFKENSPNRYLIKLQFQKTAFNFSINKISADDLYEVLKDRKVKVERI